MTNIIAVNFLFQGLYKIGTFIFIVIVTRYVALKVVGQMYFCFHALAIRKWAIMILAQYGIYYPSWFSRDLAARLAIAVQMAG